ncbi:MAG: polyribonucleotide nucleotidyltransferase, polyribonucleotide nucleotidyltransferase [Candidatus Gottesmanbacteria bacterium GW2011_GWA2_43_14]|uniref:Polyribonucleotide nucleotidyltransferase n=1 Tax=Candidatus Gottesmanbacteria bacterium GW2011_GWA2_43_14 TaxID=1618443 RepID=A0A0G1DEE9_9BACT|nr:MAG: polyribonucleotide nucleotidyltransferase, polyribonucleotide nucleotidyltransferase [Candidatus Gottesmanbacteria bacterium GW2011_GWA2_43_14]
MKVISKSAEIGGRTLSLEVGRFAEQATAAVLARYGDTMVIATVMASAKESNLDYFPLSVEYVERLYAGGRIKGSRWVKREGRPSDDAILRARLIDRSIRPLFDYNYHHDVQVIITILSVDGQNEPDILGMIAVSAALSISPLPWKGPIGAVRVGLVPTENGDKGFFANPGDKELEFSDMDLIVSGTADKTVMIEAGGNEISEENMFSGIKFASDEIKKIIKLINELQSAVGKEKIVVDPDADIEKLKSIIKKDFQKEIDALVTTRVSKEREGNETSDLIDKIAATDEEYDKKDIEKALEYNFKETIRRNILEKNKRPDGRKADEIRDIEGEVGLLPRTHGSAMFRRGQTQALTVATLGSPSMEQLIESPEGETAKRYIHHYSMPPYSVGETGRVGFPSRREVGHGALAERALWPVIPPQSSFPYTVRLVSEIMSSNGSTSMASTCGSTLALMDAGVPIKSPVSGISIGLVGAKNKYVLLTDIIGIEDFTGDMDFKVAGSEKGITAIQLDVKNDGLSQEIIQETLEKARTARLYILKEMLKVLPQSRTHISQYAPKIKVVTIPKEKIGEVIGPGGKIIRQIIAETGCDINVNDDGQVTIAGIDPEKVEIAFKWVSGIIKEVQPGEVYEGLVRRILSFGAFVEILPGREGMVHVSQMATDFVSNPNDVVTIGQKVTVRVMEIDDQGRINLSMLFGEDAKKRPPQPRRDSGPPRRDRFGPPKRRRF